MTRLTDLQKAVLIQMGEDDNIQTLEDVSNTYLLGDLKDVANYGAEAGWVGFTYFSDTVKFFDDNKKLIMDSLKELSSDLEKDLLKMIADFNCLHNNYSVDEIAKVIYGNFKNDNECTIKNALSWYALEEAASQLYDDITDYLNNMEEV